MQPFQAWSIAAGHQVVDALAADERLILPALQAVQAVFGHVPAEAVPLVADLLNVSVADVHGVLTFYHELRTSPPAPITLAVCVAEACQANGARELVAHLEGTLAPVGGRSSDGQVELAEVFCLGNCALGPAALVNQRPVGRLSADRIDWVLSVEREAIRS